MSLRQRLARRRAPEPEPVVRVLSVRRRPERLEHLVLPQTVHLETLAHLREAGRRRREQGAFWGGLVSAEGVGLVTTLYLPRTRNNFGWVEISDEGVLERLNQAVAERGEYLLAQVHSHPRDAFHSETDDAGAICGDPGFLSIVVPNYADRDYGPDEWAAFELTGGGWREWDRAERRARLEVRAHRLEIQAKDALP